MGKLYDSMRERGKSMATAPFVGTSPKLQVLSADHELAQVDDHVVMPFYEVPADDEITQTISPHPSAKSIQSQTSAESPVQPSFFESRLKVETESSLHFSAAEPLAATSLSHIAEEVIVVHQPESLASREYRSLAEQLIHELTQLQGRSLTLLPLQQQSVSELVVNLGCAWADITRHPLVLIDAARSRPGDDLACYFGLSHAPGWEELMTGSSLGEALQQTGKNWLDLIGPGKRLAWSTTHAWASRTHSILHELTKHYRHILLLGPSFPHSPLGLVLAETTDSTCILLPASNSSLMQQESVQRILNEHGKSVLGCIQLDS
jgi:hypothetical protein